MLLNEIGPYRGRRRPSSYSAEVPLVLQHPDYTGNEEEWFAEPMVEVEFSMSEDDPSVGYKGGADEILSVKAAEPFDFMNVHVEAGQDIPEEMFKYWSPSHGIKDVYKYLLISAEENAGEGMYDDDGDYEYDRRKDEGYYD